MYSLRPQVPFPRLVKLNCIIPWDIPEQFDSYNSPKKFYESENDQYSYETWRNKSTKLWWQEIENGQDPGYPPWIHVSKIIPQSHVKKNIEEPESDEFEK